jgi:hypothetical protein
MLFLLSRLPEYGFSQITPISVFAHAEIEMISHKQTCILGHTFHKVHQIEP